MINVAQINDGGQFGADALDSNNKRNATILCTTKTYVAVLKK